MNAEQQAQVSDLMLIEMTRNGDNNAFTVLWDRHAPAITAVSRRFTGFDPEDITQETFLRIFQQIQAGQGPNTAFRAYAIMTARNIAVNMAHDRRNADLTGYDDAIFDHPDPLHLGTEDQVLGESFTMNVFTSLPLRWQEVLWYRDVEDLRVKELCTYIGLEENAASALLKRAREGFKQAWIAAHLEPKTDLSPECQWASDNLPKAARGKASSVTIAKLDAHINVCPDCGDLAQESNRIQKDLALVLLPGIIGSAAALDYVSSTQSGTFLPSDTSASISATGSDTGSPFSTQMPPASPNTPLIVTIAVVATAALATAITFANTVQDLPTVPQQPAATSETPQETAPEDPSSSQTQERQEQTNQSSAPDEPGTPASSDNSSGGIGEPGEAPEEPDKATTVPPVRLSAAPKDGVEYGIFPELIGTSTPNARITILTENEQGLERRHTLKADATGQWAFTPDSLRGTISVQAQQSYVDNKAVITDPPVAIGTFDIGQGLSIEIDEVSTSQTTLTLRGATASAKNRVVTIESSTLGSLAAKEPASAEGSFTLTVPHGRADLGDLRYWQGDTSEGPKRITWRTL